MKKENLNTINLDATDYISEGCDKYCYQHPENSSLCIKIGKPNAATINLGKELEYFKKIKNKDTSKFEYLFYAQYHGEIQTNIGTGHVYDLIKDATTNTVSSTLLHYLEIDDSPFSDHYLAQELQRLKDQMIKHKIHAGDIRARNICVNILNDHSMKLVIIDGLGHRDFIPLADWFHYFSKKKIERRFVKNNLHSLEVQRKEIEDMRGLGASS